MIWSGKLLAVALFAISFAFVVLAVRGSYLLCALLGVYALMSGITFLVYAADKARARRGDWRIPEATLHLLAILGGWPGALLAQRRLRHKNRKLLFQGIFWMIVLVHIAFWILLAPKRS